MVVDEGVAAALREQRAVRVSGFVARCSERMVQLFTGLRSGEPGRDADLDIVLEVVESLWRDDDRDEFTRLLDGLSSFPEFEPNDEGLSEASEIYSLYSLLALRYALEFRVTGDVGRALSCAHICLTATAQLDQNAAGTTFTQEEEDLQRAAVGEDGPDLSESTRVLDRQISRRRLSAVRDR